MDTKIAYEQLSSLSGDWARPGVTLVKTGGLNKNPM